MKREEYRYYNFRVNADIIIGENKSLHTVVVEGSVMVKRKNGGNFLLLDAENYFLLSKKVILPTKRKVSLKNIVNRSIYYTITVYKS